MPADFLDSNVIVYMFDGDVRKRAIAREIVSDAAGSHACISFQIVQEVLNVLQRREVFSGNQQALFDVMEDVLIPLWEVMPSARLYRRAVETRTRYRYAFYDSLIIAAALEAGCSRLYSEDLQDGQRIEGLTITNPFA